MIVYSVNYMYHPSPSYSYWGHCPGHNLNVSTVRVTWQWTSSDPAPDCFNTTSVFYHPDGGDEFFLQLSDPAATEATLTDLQCSTSYTITDYTSSGSTDTRSAPRIVSLPARGIFTKQVHTLTFNYCFTDSYHASVPLQPYPLPLRSLCSPWMFQLWE